MLSDVRLDAYRNRIDTIDDELISLLNERYDICLMVGQRKKELGIKTIQDPEREEQIMKKLEVFESHSGMVRKLWPVIMEFSRSLQ